MRALPDATQSSGQISWERERLLEALEAFDRGRGEAPLLRKWRGAACPPVEGDPEQMGFVLSTDEVDRYGDVIEAGGWDLAAYRSNPVFLWAHDYARPVIGRAVDTWLESHRLLARMEFAATPFAMEVAGLYRAGYQRGVSVGFRPLRYRERRDEKTGALLGIRFLEQELLEVSAVPVPANGHALKRALDQAPRAGEYLRRAASGPEPEPGSDPALANAAALAVLGPALSAGLDELGKLAGELSRLAREAGLDGGAQPEAPESTGPGDSGESGIAALLAALREARR